MQRLELTNFYFEIEMDSSKLMLTALNFNERINRQDLEGLAELMTDNHTLVVIANNKGETSKGKNVVVEGWRDFFKKYPDYRNIFTSVTIQDNVVVMVAMCSFKPLAGPNMWTAKGLVSVGAHGSEHYWEAIDATFRAITKRYVLGYRLVFWPRIDKDVEDMLVHAGLSNIETFKALWRNDFPSGGEAYDFFAAVTASWWYAKFASDKISADSEKTRRYFERKRITRITDDVIFAYGTKSN